MVFRKALCVLPFVALTSCAGAIPSAPSPMLGQTVRLDLPGEDGQKIAVPVPRARATVLEFWSTACEPCRERVPALVARELDLQAKGAKLVLVAVLSQDEVDRDAKAVLESWGVHGHPFAIDHGAVQAKLGLKDVPCTAILKGDVLRWVAPPGAEVGDIVGSVP